MTMTATPSSHELAVELADLPARLRAAIDAEDEAAVLLCWAREAILPRAIKRARLAEIDEALAAKRDPMILGGLRAERDRLLRELEQ